MHRRDFIKTVGAASLAAASSDLVADLLAQSPPRRVLESKFKGLADIALAEAKAAGCSYADIRFTRAANSSVTANGGTPIGGAPGEAGEAVGFGGFGGGGFGGGGRGGGRGGGFGGGGGG